MNSVKVHVGRPNNACGAYMVSKTIARWRQRITATTFSMQFGYTL